MAYVKRQDICFCDLCGKRIYRTEARLTLMKRPPQGSYTWITEKSWLLCKGCMGKAIAMECVGDKIKQEIETKLANIQIENHPLKLLK
jgi:hypothetical protein